MFISIPAKYAACHAVLLPFRLAWFIRYREPINAALCIEPVIREA